MYFKYYIMEEVKKENYSDKKPVGRPRGATNKLTRNVKETVLDVFIQMQDDPKKNLLEFGKKYPIHFYQMAAKLIPTELTGTSTQVIRVLSAEFDNQEQVKDSEIKKALDEYLGDEASYEPID